MHYRLVVIGNDGGSEEMFPKRNEKLHNRVKGLKELYGKEKFRTNVRLERHFKNGKVAMVRL